MEKNQTLIAKVAQRLFELGRQKSEIFLLKDIDPSILSVEQLRRLKAYGEESEDFDLILKAVRYLLAKLKKSKNDDGLKEYKLLQGSDWGALAALYNLPECTLPIEPIRGRVIYLLHHSLPFFSNGYATRGHGLAKGMKAAGIDLICITRPGFPLDIKRELESAAEHDEIDGVQYIRIENPKWTGPNRSRNYIFDAVDAIEKQIRDLKPQAIIAASNYIAALPTLLAARRCGIPMAYEVRGFWEITNASRDPDVEKSMEHQLKVRIDSKLAAMADQVFTLSQSMKDELVRRKVPKENIELLPNCCDPNTFIPQVRDSALATKFKLPEGIPVIGYVGSFVDYEGLDDLTRACAMLRRDGHVFRLLLVGASQGALYDRIRSIAEAEGLGDWLVLPGRVSHDQVGAWYSLIDIAPFPRKSLPVTELVTPLKPLEAMAMQKAVVISSVAAMAEMVRDEVTGLVFSKDDQSALASTLARLLTDPGLRIELGKQARGYLMSERTWVIMGMKIREWINHG